MSTKIIIAGGRDYPVEGYEELENTVELLLYLYDGDIEIVSGNCNKGVDVMGEAFAKAHDIPLKLFPADWGQFGHAAGPVRNRAMAEYSDVLIAFWDGESKGTRGMIHDAMDLGLDVHVHRYVK